MAKKNAMDDSEGGGYAPSVPGIRGPFTVPEAGHEGARAVSDFRSMCEGRIVSGNDAADKFVDYDSALNAGG